jgi:hypothetical protein
LGELLLLGYMASLIRWSAGMSSRHAGEVIDRVLSAIHGYTIGVRVGGGVLEFNFVDRELEVRRLLDPGEGVIVGGWVTVLYGPKGCGKTELFKALSSTVASLGDVDIDIVIVASEREAWRVERLYAPRSLAEVASAAIESLGGSIEVQAGGSWEVKGFVPLDKLVSLLVGYIAYKHPTTSTVPALPTIAMPLRSSPYNILREPQIAGRRSPTNPLHMLTAK